MRMYELWKLAKHNGEPSRLAGLGLTPQSVYRSAQRGAETPSRVGVPAQKVMNMAT